MAADYDKLFRPHEGMEAPDDMAAQPFFDPSASFPPAPASDEFDLVRAWQRLHDDHAVALHICVAAALRRGVTDEQEAQQLGLPGHNLQPGFTLSGLGALAKASLTCDRMVQF